MKVILEAIFRGVSEAIELENNERRKSGAPRLVKAEIILLGQMSLQVSKRVSSIASLAQTADMDALIKADYFVKEKLRELLAKNGLVYDEDSDKVFIPKKSKFEDLFSFKNLSVRAIDPESALVSKAVKAPMKNKQLLRQVIDKGEFKKLLDRIEENGGDLKKLITN